MAEPRILKRVLLVDDDKHICAGLKRIFDAWAAQHGVAAAVEISPNGAAALASARQDPPPTLIISDTHMPVMGGMELLRAVRERSQVPFLLMSGMGLTAAETEEVARLNATHMPKPFDLTLIAAKLAEAFFPPPPAQERPKYVCVVADDESLNRESLADFLTHLGFEVLKARDGTDTLKYCQSRHVDFVISDYQMGGLDGVLCLVQLRKEDRHMPYLVLSGRSDRDVIAIIESHGASFRQKPLSNDAVMEWLRTFNFLTN